VQLTPLLVRSGPDVVPVKGSDGRYHLLWEVPLQNGTSLQLTVTGIEIEGDGSILHAMDQAEIARSVEVIGTRRADPVVGPAQGALVFLTLAFDARADLPRRLTHRVTVAADRLPAPITTRGGEVAVDTDALVPILGPPLEAGRSYIAADGCCRSVRHIRAPLPLNNDLWFAQRFAIDWEQVDARGAFVVGDASNPRNYIVYGKQVLAPADGQVILVRDGLEDQVPGQLPGTALPLDEVDGNSVVIDIGDGLFTLSGHMQKGSLRVNVGDRVHRGQPIGLVGNTGNSSAPHLHFHVMDGPSPLTSNGRPYVIDSFSIVGRGVSTAEFDRVENTEEPLAIVPPEGEPRRTNALPLDLLILNFD
ncbi:MAG: M23 family metallopeptidase, partial [Mycobacterium sp.]